MAKVANTAEIMRREAAKQKLLGPTVLLRVRKGCRAFYGRPIPWMREEGAEVKVLLKHLKPWIEPKKGEKAKVYLGGQPLRSILIEMDGEKTKYELPSWGEDASIPVEQPPADDEDETFLLSGTEEM